MQRNNIFLQAVRTYKFTTTNTPIDMSELELRMSDFVTELYHWLF